MTNKLRLTMLMKISQRVSSLSRIDGGFEIKTGRGEKYQARAAIIATDKRPRPLNVPGEEKLKDKGLTCCAICDGPLFAGMKVAVIGGNNSALEATDDMIKIAEHIHLISLTPPTGGRILIDKGKDANNLILFLK